MDSNNKIFALEVLLKHKSITETFASCLLVICNFPGFGNCGLYSFQLLVFYLKKLKRSNHISFYTVFNDKIVFFCF